MSESKPDGFAKFGGVLVAILAIFVCFRIIQVAPKISIIVIIVFLLTYIAGKNSSKK